MWRMLDRSVAYIKEGDMNILLINPPIRVDRPPYNFPLGLGYIAAVLLKEAHNVNVIDMDGRRYNQREFDAALGEYLDKVDAIGIGGLITTYKTQVSIVKTIRRMGYEGQIILGGGLATSEYEILFQNLDIDICVIGEGERTIRELAYHLENNLDLAGVKGIIYKKCGRITKNPPVELIDDLDSLPFPAWDLFPIQSYLRTYYHGYLVPDQTDLNEMVMFTSRGCPFRCNFCYHINGYRYRYRSVDSIFEEIELLKYKYGKRLHVRFLDDCFVVNRNRLIEFCNRIIREKVRITWSCMGRANVCTREILKLMKRAGCIYVGYGLESGNDAILKNVIRKNSTVKQNIRAVRDSLDLGLISSPTIMTNQPGENAKTIRDTVNMVRKIGCSNTVLFYACPYPGTPLWDYAVEKNLIKLSREAFLERIADQDVNQLIVNLTDLPDQELIRLHDKAEKKIRRINRRSIRRLTGYMKAYGIEKTLSRALRRIWRNYIGIIRRIWHQN